MGIARGTGTVVTLANSKENLVMLKEKASANYSFNNGTSTQSYPSSMMGVLHCSASHSWMHNGINKTSRRRSEYQYGSLE
jgi:hypothetical protein